MSDTARLLIDLFLLFAAARLAGTLFLRLNQPAVVGEILAGLLIGPHLLGLVSHTPSQDAFAQLGVVFLLFVVGLETDPARLWRVGRHALLVAALGVTASFGLGYALLRGFHSPIPESLFVATAVAATSVGLAGRVLADLGKLGTVVASVILGAAIVDDVLGMLLLAVVSNAARGAFSGREILILVAETVAFLGLAVLLGRPAVHRLTPRLARYDEDQGRSPIFALAVILCFAFSALAEVIGLAAIIGAFFAGVIFAETEEAPELRRSMRPIYELLVPIFFVLLGVRVDLPALAHWSLLGLGALVILAAIFGKLLGCGLGALRLGKREALAVALGMIPRGEISLVIALVGLSRGVISSGIYSTLVLMCLVTSLLAPPLLRAALARPTRIAGGER